MVEHPNLIYLLRLYFEIVNLTLHNWCQTTKKAPAELSVDAFNLNFIKAVISRRFPQSVSNYSISIPELVSSLFFGNVMLKTPLSTLALMSLALTPGSE